MSTRDSRRLANLASPMGMIGLSLLVFVSTSVLLPKLGYQTFTLALIGTVFLLIYLGLSFKSLAIPFYMTVLAVGGFKFLVAIKAPILPDLYLDRMMLLWLILIFMIKFFAEGKRPKGPYGLDILILIHGTYIFARIWAYGFTNFSPWTHSILVPYLMYFFSKNIMETRKQLRILYVLLLILGFYYSVSSIAQKFHLDFMLYPTYMRLPSPGWPGRSTGPYSNPGIFGNALGMILPINLYFLATVRSRAWKTIVTVNLALCFLGLYFTYTRGAWMCSMAGLATVLLLNRKHYLKTMAPLLVTFPLLGIVGLGLGQDEFMKERVEQEDTVGARLGTAVTALRVWRDHPFLGCGSFRFLDVQEAYVEPVAIPGFETIRFAQFRHTAPHDMYLGPLSEDGLVGQGLIFTIYFIMIRNLIRGYRGMARGEHFGTYIVPLFAGVMVTYLVGGFTQSFRHTSILGTMLFMYAGIASCYNREKFES